jgi:hypothetical protein
MKSSVIEVITKRLKVTDPALAARGYEDLLQATDRKPFPSLEGLRNVQRLMRLQNPAVAGLKTENLIDGKLMKELDETASTTSFTPPTELTQLTQEMVLDSSCAIVKFLEGALRFPAAVLEFFVGFFHEGQIKDVVDFDFTLHFGRVFHRVNHRL